MPSLAPYFGNTSLATTAVAVTSNLPTSRTLQVSIFPDELVQSFASLEPPSDLFSISNSAPQSTPNILIQYFNISLEWISEKASSWFPPRDFTYLQSQMKREFKVLRQLFNACAEGENFGSILYENLRVYLRRGEIRLKEGDLKPEKWLKELKILQFSARTAVKSLNSILRVEDKKGSDFIVLNRNMLNAIDAVFSRYLSVLNAQITASAQITAVAHKKLSKLLYPLSTSALQMANSLEQFGISEKIFLEQLGNSLQKIAEQAEALETDVENSAQQTELFDSILSLIQDADMKIGSGYFYKDFAEEIKPIQKSLYNLFVRVYLLDQSIQNWGFHYLSSYVNKAIAANSENCEAYLLSAILLESINPERNSENVLAKINQSLKTHEENESSHRLSNKQLSTAYAMRALHYYLSNDSTKIAKLEYNRKLSANFKDRNDIDCRYYILEALCAFDQGNLETAAKYAEQALAQGRSVHHHHSYAILALQAVNNNDFKLAESYALKAFNLNVDNPYAQRVLALSKLKIGNPNEAIGYYKQVMLQLGRFNLKTQIEIINEVLTMMDFHDSDFMYYAIQAVSTIQDKVAVADKPRIHYFLALCYLNTNQFSLALKNIDAVVDMTLSAEKIFRISE